MMATVFNALQGVNEYGEDITYRLQGDIDGVGLSRSQREEHVRSGRRTRHHRYGSALSLGEHFSRIFENPYEAPKSKASS